MLGILRAWQARTGLWVCMYLLEWILIRMHSAKLLLRLSTKLDRGENLVAWLGGTGKVAGRHEACRGAESQRAPSANTTMLSIPWVVILFLRFTLCVSHDDLLMG